MNNKLLINFNLSEIAEGAVQAKFAKEVEKVCKNILDLNTDATKKRKITISLTYIPNDQRNSVDVVVETKSTLAPQVGTSTTMLLDRDLNTGYMAANELKSKIPGQTYIDIEDGKPKTDIGEPVDEVESKKETKKNSEDKKNIIDLQKNKA
ncbi:MAG TPA: replication terminator protein [Candidatus Companilactobacillus pullicola]|uniref:Replication terminator protein n=1 Tax=Candidatus Companilactobacillus pullicola TaxID=2838523 RepID=A0A9D1ZL45_9LACO|nr:replication terminator protein [Candidatus Companilactobacillus pullicola]